MKAFIWMLECSIIFPAFIGKFGEAVKCYHCEVENENCADPLNPEAEGVQICEGEFCIKSSTTYQGFVFEHLYNITRIIILDNTFCV